MRESGLPPAGQQGALTPQDESRRAGQENGDCLDSHVVALTSTSKECLVDQEEIERDDEPSDHARKHCRQPVVHQLPHHILAPGEHYKRDKGKGNTKAEDHLA